MPDAGKTEAIATDLTVMAWPKVVEKRLDLIALIGRRGVL